MECRLTGEAEVLGKKLLQRHFCPSQNPTWPDPGLNPGRRGGTPTTNRLSYGAATRCDVLLLWCLIGSLAARYTKLFWEIDSCSGGKVTSWFKGFGRSWLQIPPPDAVLSHSGIQFISSNTTVSEVSFHLRLDLRRIFSSEMSVVQKLIFHAVA
jgi:hypothetical protein